ncbi:hypothetical protein FPOAC2_07721 [Fusarium poae]
MSDKETLPPAQPIVLSMKVSETGSSDSHYRLQLGKKVKYLVVGPKVFDRDALASPIQFFPRLPDSKDWTVAHFSRDEITGDLKISILNRTLPGVKCHWHPTRVDCLDLEKTKSLTATNFEAVSHSTILPRGTMIAKMARFEWELPRIERETKAYRLLQASGLTLRFLGHITENGRIIGFLLEKMEGRPAGWKDLDACRDALGKLHRLKLLHGAIWQRNFLLTEQ